MNSYFTRNVAVTAINIIDGMELEPHLKEISAAYEKRAMGFIEFSCWVADIAEQLNVYVDSLKPKEFPGVWDYEVAYPLGQKILQHIKDNGLLPEEGDVVAWGNELTDRFFAQGA